MAGPAFGVRGPMLFLIIKTLDQLKPIYWMVLYRVYVFVPLENKQQKQETPIASIEIWYLFLFVLFSFLSFGLCLFVFVLRFFFVYGVFIFQTNLMIVPFNNPNEIIFKAICSLLWMSSSPYSFFKHFSWKLNWASKWIKFYRWNLLLSKLIFKSGQ